MQDIDTTSTQSLIDRYYEEEKAQREREQTLAALSIHLDANDLAMLNVIARRFRKGRDEVAQEILSNALIDLFARVEAGERKLLARDADDAARAIADEIAEENGIASVEIKSGIWANHDRQITKLERKKAKMMEQNLSPAGNNDKQVAEENSASSATTGNEDMAEDEQDLPGTITPVSSEEDSEEYSQPAPASIFGS